MAARSLFRAKEVRFLRAPPNRPGEAKRARSSIAVEGEVDTIPSSCDPRLNLRANLVNPYKAKTKGECSAIV